MRNLMAERGAFKAMHLAMMVHPAPFDAAMAKIITPLYLKSLTRARNRTRRPFWSCASVPRVRWPWRRPPSDFYASRSGRGFMVTHGGDAPNICPAHSRQVLHPF